MTSAIPPLPPGPFFSEGMAVVGKFSIRPCECRHCEGVGQQGKLILDAMVALQAILYPTDLSPLNEAREFREKIIDILNPGTEMNGCCLALAD